MKNYQEEKKMNSKNTKRALLTSVLAMVVCLAMLIGSTFAWFTDTATTGVNKIVSGNLAVDIVSKEGTSLQGKALNFVKADNVDEAILWEPGCTYVTEPFMVVNKGNLALKYKLVINGLDGDSDLLDVITFDVVKEPTKEAAAVKLDEFVGKLAGNTSDEAIMIRGKMDTAAGNDYQNKTLAGISITVVATQDAVESDSFDNMYDDGATYPEYTVADKTALKDAIAVGGVVSPAKDIVYGAVEDTVDDRVIITAPTVLNLGDKKIVSPDDMGNLNTNFCALVVDADTTINASSNGGIDTGTNGGYGINVRNGATLTINGGTYYGGGTAIQVQKGTLIINGGFFAVEPYSNPVYGYKFLLNGIDAAIKNGTAKISITGGTFVNYDPSNSASENPEKNFVAKGYKVVSETKDNGDVWYTVVAE